MRRLDRAQLADEIPVAIDYLLLAAETSFEISVVRQNDNIVLGEVNVCFNCMRPDFYGALEGLEGVLRVCCFITSMGNGLREYSPILVLAGPCPVCYFMLAASAHPSRQPRTHRKEIHQCFRGIRLFWVASLLRSPERLRFAQQWRSRVHHAFGDVHSG